MGDFPDLDAARRTAVDAAHGVWSLGADAASWTRAQLEHALKSDLFVIGLTVGNQIGTVSDALDLIGLGEFAYKQYARAYIAHLAVPGVVGYEAFRAHGRGGGIRDYLNANLSGDMLQMYVNERLDPEVISRVGEAIAVSATFAHLVQFVADEVAVALAAVPSPAIAQVRAAADAALLNAPGPAPKGIDFYFGGEGLQPVIGGVSGMRTADGSITSILPDAKGQRTLTCQLKIEIRDEYDFDNDRRSLNAAGKKVENVYTRFRTLLADLLKQRKFSKFEMAYTLVMNSVPFTGGDYDHLNRGHVFASYMYAVEQAGYFKPIAWKVQIPAQVEIVLAAPGPSVKVAPASGF
ncbi:hypothetical protein BH11PLA1_BH11PLA1_17910 [soil metagenome]